MAKFQPNKLYALDVFDYLKIVPDPDIEGYHRAEADVEMLIAILKMLDF